jgi:anti-sigma factor RsiW
LTEHLTQNQVENYCQQKLSVTELLSVSDHLGACRACRQQIESALGGDTAFFALQSEVFGEAAEILSSPAAAPHPAFEQMAEYVDGRLAGEELQIVKDHLASCERCTAAVSDLRAFRNQVAPQLDREYQPATGSARTKSWWQRLAAFVPSPQLRSPALAFGSALAAILLTMAGWLIWQTLQKRGAKQEIVVTTPTPTVTSTSTPVVTPTASSTPAPLIAELNDGEDRVMLDAEGKLSGVDRLPPVYQQMVKGALATERLEKSSLLAGLARPGSVLLGDDQRGNKFSVIEPIGKVLLSDRPTFRWSPLAGATGYVVEVYDEKFNLAATSPQLTDNSWTAMQPLKRGGIYSWQVKAIKDGQELRSPRPPAPQAKFRLLDQAKANELVQARRTYASSHLTLGLLYAQAGLLDEAERELRALQKANPDSAIIRQWLASVRAMRR